MNLGTITDVRGQTAKIKFATGSLEEYIQASTCLVLEVDRQALVEYIGGKYYIIAIF